jgi:hypothetical protein
MIYTTIFEIIDPYEKVLKLYPQHQLEELFKLLEEAVEPV